MALDLEESRNFIEKYINSTEKTESNNEDIVKILEELKDFEMTKELLTKSKIGVSVNKLRKCEIENVQKIATDLLMKWKDLMIPPKRKLESEEINESNEKTGKTEAAEKNGQASPSPEPAKITKVADSSSNGSSDIKEYFIGDSVRDKCLEMLVTALMTDQPEGQNPDELIINTAQSIERSLFNEFKSTSSAYKSKFRSKYLNLKDSNNPTLRSGLISGIITPDRFISMTSAEMASDERKRINSMIAEQNLLNSQMAKDNAAETDQFKCGRCNQRKCKYYQMQTRSADEPMTTFVTCVNCGNRWRAPCNLILTIMKSSSSPLQQSFDIIKDNPVIKNLTPIQVEALKFGLGATFLGTSGGLLFGGVTTLMRGLQDTPEGRANMARSFKLFSIAGITYAITGSSLMIVNEEDSYTNRMAAGCSAGLSLGIFNRSLPVACVGCVSLAALAAFTKRFDVNSLNEKSEFLKELNRPVFRKDEKWE